MPADPQRARDLFLHAVGKLPPEEWDAYLAEACGLDAELKGHVLHLLEVHREAGSFLERPAAGVAATGVFTPRRKRGPPPSRPRPRAPPSALTSCSSRLARAAWAWYGWRSRLSRSSGWWR